MKLCNFEVGLEHPLFLIAGPCVIESKQMAIDTAGALKEIAGSLGISFIYKSSYDKANRSSNSTFRGFGMEEGLRILDDVRAQIGVPILTDVHTEEQVPHVCLLYTSTVLENESIKLENLNLWLTGIGDETTAHAMSDDALKNIPSDASVIVTMHDPGSLLKVSENWQNPNALFLAGHTHGGQVYLPGYGAPVVPSAAPREWAYGWVQHNHHNMYVTSGLGVSICLSLIHI